LEDEDHGLARRPKKGVFMFARIATYRFKADPKEVAKKVEGGLLPIFMKQPGFRDYSLFADTKEVQAGPGEHQFIALTLWDSLEEATQGVEAAFQWVSENMSNELEWTDTKFVEVLLSTSFGLSPSWEDPK
jgi:heme-degrading monooxygenase HmoA